MRLGRAVGRRAWKAEGERVRCRWTQHHGHRCRAGPYGQGRRRALCALLFPLVPVQRLCVGKRRPKPGIGMAKRKVWPGQVAVSVSVGQSDLRAHCACARQRQRTQPPPPALSLFGKSRASMPLRGTSGNRRLRPPSSRCRSVTARQHFTHLPAALPLQRHSALTRTPTSSLFIQATAISTHAYSSAVGLSSRASTELSSASTTPFTLSTHRTLSPLPFTTKL